LDPGNPPPLGAAVSLRDGITRTINWFRERR
jgi:hypothetical protein